MVQTSGDSYGCKVGQCAGIVRSPVIAFSPDVCVTIRADELKSHMHLAVGPRDGALENDIHVEGACDLWQ